MVSHPQLLIILALIVVMTVGFAVAVKRLGMPNWRKAVSIVVFGAVVFGWYFLMARLGESGTLTARRDATGIPPIAMAFLAPIAIGFGVFRLSTSCRELAAAVPLVWLIGIQVSRILGAIFLVRYAQGELPGAFAIPAGVGDVLIGLTAIPVAWAVLNRRPPAKSLALFWNWAGILDLVVAVLLGFSTAPTPLQWLAIDRPSQLPFPLLMIPAYGVPLAILLHLVSLWSIKNRWREQPDSGRAPGGTDGRKTRS